MSEGGASTRREPVVYEVGGLKVFGVVHRPRERASEGGPGVAIFHGFVGSKDTPARIFVELAEELAKSGILALRVDFPGRGDSEGETVDISVAADMETARRAVDYLAAEVDVDPERLGLVGMSWGGAIAACLAGRDDRVGAVALWSSVPVRLDWKPEFQEIGGRQVAEMWGNIVGREFYGGLSELNPPEEIRQARGPLLLVWGSEDEVVPESDVDRFRQEMARAGIPLHVARVEGADHAFLRYDWKRQAVEATALWFREVW